MRTSATIDEPAEVLGLRERKKARVRHDLAMVGLRMIGERGFDAVTVEDIAATVDVSIRTFYRYFSTKEDLVFGDEAETLEFFAVAFQAQPATLPLMVALRQALIAIAEATSDLGDTKIQAARIIDATPSLKVRRAERQAAWEQAFAPLVAVRLGNLADQPSLHARIVAASAVAVLRVAFASWRDEHSTSSLVDRVTETFDLLRDSWSTEPANL